MDPDKEEKWLDDCLGNVIVSEVYGANDGPKIDSIEIEKVAEVVINSTTEILKVPENGDVKLGKSDSDTIIKSSIDEISKGKAEELAEVKNTSKELADNEEVKDAPEAETVKVDAGSKLISENENMIDNKNKSKIDSDDDNEVKNFSEESPLESSKIEVLLDGIDGSKDDRSALIEDDHSASIENDLNETIPSIPEFNNVSRKKKKYYRKIIYKKKKKKHYNIAKFNAAKSKAKPKIETSGDMEDDNLKDDVPPTVDKLDEINKMDEDTSGFPHGVLSDEDLMPRRNLRERRSMVPTNQDVDYDDDSSNEIMDDFLSKKNSFGTSKRNYRRMRAYTNDAVKEAVKQISSNTLTLLEAAKQYSIPKSSLVKFLSRYKRGKSLGIKQPSPRISKEEENEMEAMIKRLSRCGKRYSHNELRFLVQFYLDTHDRQVFKSGTLPTMGWISGLIERHPSLHQTKTKKNSKAAYEDAEEWHANITDHLTTDWEVDPEAMFQLENKHRVFCYQSFRILMNGPADSETKNVKKEPGIDEPTEEVNVIVGMSAAEEFDIPIVLFPEEKPRLQTDIDSNSIDVRYTANARLDHEIALKLVKDLDAKVNKEEIEKPIIFLVNDKQDMAHFSVIDYCWENQIIIICLPPKTGKTLTPFDIAIWPKLRNTYNLLWRKETKGFDGKVGVDQFTSIFIQAWKVAIKDPTHAMRGFNKSGIIPFDVPIALKEQPNNPVPSPVKTELNVAKLTKVPISNNYEDDDEEIAQHVAPMQYSQLQQQISSPELDSQDEFNKGQLEGIQLCLRAMEECVAPDIKPVWERREQSGGSSSRWELSYKLWRAVALLYKADCAMASIREMTEGNFTCSLDRQLLPTMESAMSSRPYSTPPSSIKTNSPTAAKVNSKPPTATKRKLNKSIYSNSNPTNLDHVDSESKKQKQSSKVPFVKLYQSQFLQGICVDD